MDHPACRLRDRRSPPFRLAFEAVVRAAGWTVPLTGGSDPTAARRR